VIAKLIESGTQGQKTVLITKDEFLIGRGSDCDLRLGSSEVSRHHCMLRLRGEKLTLTDLGSSNGTYINGLRVRSQAPLHHGDELRISSFVFQVELDEQEGITWYKDPDVDPSAHTQKLRDFKRPARKDGDQPPGDAGGLGGSPGQGSG
jgi:pSer/pThr/pTyr-binding forkhead associated (FHA) protein